jgi:DNA invertase Pin-like site-specific DNA recombinase
MSLDTQEARIRAWCEAQAAQLVEIVREEGVSGTKLLADRPGGRQIAELLESRRPAADTVVVVHGPSRA